MSAQRSRCLIVFFASLFLFAQAAVAAQGCLLTLDTVPEKHECNTTPMEAGVCVIHCVGVDQSTSAPDHHFIAHLSSTTAAPPDFLLVATRSPARALCDSRRHVPRSAQVLFCSYQT